MSLRHLFSRFDRTLLSALATSPATAPTPATAAPRTAVAASAAAALPAISAETGAGAADRQRGHTLVSAAEWRALCMQGVADSALPWWQPLGQRRPAVPWAQHSADADAGPGLIALAADLDGSLRLQACQGRRQRLALRAQVKLADARWWRARRADHIWDAGQLIDGPDLALRVRRFEPRRATLILALDIEPARLLAAANELAARSADFDYPVRLIWLVADAAMVGPSGSRLSSRNAPNSHERMPINNV